MNLTLDRPGLIRNPTSCEPGHITLNATTADATAQLWSPFQVADCAVLGFEPRLAVRISGGLGRGGHPGLRAVLRTGADEAGLRGLSLKLPPGELLDLRHIRALCDRRVPPADCPADSRLGYARLFSPLLDAPLQGPIYLRRPSGHLPDLIADLRHGQVHILIQGTTAAPAGRLQIRFPAFPDVPLTKGSSPSRVASRHLRQQRKAL